MIRETKRFGLILLLFWCMSCAQAASPSLLFTRGYRVIPEPQKLELNGDDFIFGNGMALGSGQWRLTQRRSG